MVLIENFPLIFNDPAKTKRGRGIQEGGGGGGRGSRFVKIRNVVPDHVVKFVSGTALLARSPTSKSASLLREILGIRGWTSTTDQQHSYNWIEIPRTRFSLIRQFSGVLILRVIFENYSDNETWMHLSPRTFFDYTVIDKDETFRRSRIYEMKRLRIKIIPTKRLRNFFFSLFFQFLTRIGK